MAVKGAFALNIQGMNVTVPHKQDVMKCLEAIDEDAKAIGAVNTWCVQSMDTKVIIQTVQA